MSVEDKMCYPPLDQIKVGDVLVAARVPHTASAGVLYESDGSDERLVKKLYSLILGEHTFMFLLRKLGILLALAQVLTMCSPYPITPRYLAEGTVFRDWP